jgi:uncharacterized protein (TIGR02145 family)
LYYFSTKSTVPKKTNSGILTIILEGLLFTVIYSCMKETLKTVASVITSPVTNITAVSAICQGEITSDAELTTLLSYLGGDAVAGGKMKESGTSHWENPNTGAPNESGFTALPGAFYLASAGWVSPGNFGMWWRATEYNSTESWNWNLDNISASLNRVSNKKTSGFSVRCLKD